jgi:hypothetical protein
MSKAIKTVAITAATFTAFASMAFAQSPRPYWGRYAPYGYAGTYAGGAATNQYTSREGLVRGAP